MKYDAIIIGSGQGGTPLRARATSPSGQWIKTGTSCELSGR
jgi:pyruvate/2-oxoglutarate dehydrogenase complex dihydrolipoamide dehydrogenase (E3) component